MKTNKSIYRVAEFAAKVGRSAETIRRMDNDGRFPAKRSATGQRYYTDADVREFLNLPISNSRSVIVYSRVSSSSQRSDLNNQIAALEMFCAARGIEVDEWVSEIGGGLNMRRPKFLDIVFGISQGEVSTLVVAHKDRLSRFGFDLIEAIAERMGTEVIVMNQETLSPEREVVEDLMSIIHTFSCRLYGLRRYKKEIKEAVTSDE